MKWKNIIFDFDGVICDSVEIKTQAFAKLYNQYGPDIENKVIKYYYYPFPVMHSLYIYHVVFIFTLCIFWQLFLYF